MPISARILALGCLVSLLAAFSGNATRADACGQALAIPNVEVKLQVKPVAHDASRGVKQLNATPRSPGPGASAIGFPQTMGLTRISVSSGMDASMIGQPRSSGDYCWSISRLTVKIDAAIVVYVAKEIPQNSCLWREVLTHEQRHVAIAQAFLPRMDDYMRPRVYAAATRTVAAKSDGEAGKLMQPAIVKVVRSALDELMSELEAQQLRIDTVEEYTRFSRACGQAEFTSVLGKAGVQQ